MSKVQVLFGLLVGILVTGLGSWLFYAGIASANLAVVGCLVLLANSIHGAVYVTREWKSRPSYLPLKGNG